MPMLQQVFRSFSYIDNHGFSLKHKVLEANGGLPAYELNFCRICSRTLGGNGCIKLAAVSFSTYSTGCSPVRAYSAGAMG